MTRRLGPAIRHGLSYGAALAVLAGVFMLYLRPEFMLTLAQQLWTCF